MAALAPSREMSLFRLAPAYAALALLLLPYLGLGLAGIPRLVRRWVAWQPGVLLVAGALILPALAALPWGDAAAPGRALGIVLFASGGLLLLLAARGRGAPPSPWDWAALAAFWLPVELGLTRGWWVREGVSPSFPMMTLVVTSLLLIGFGALRKLEGIGYRWRIRGTDLVVGTVALSAVLVVAVPVGLASGFVAFGPRAISGSEFIFSLLGIGLFVALPEEILFRGLLFNMLQRSWAGRLGPYPALILSAMLFGLTRLDRVPLMDWPNVVLAMIAGLSYGWCYLRTGSLMPGILAHTVVDLLHRFILTPPVAAP
jgi:membrane protease YdiL (CAAX protease family)